SASRTATAAPTRRLRNLHTISGGSSASTSGSSPPDTLRVLVTCAASIRSGTTAARRPHRTSGHDHYTPATTQRGPDGDDKEIRREGPGAGSGGRAPD